MAEISLPTYESTATDRFAAFLADVGQSLERVALTTLQLNLGKMCNLACHHCHVEAGPNRTEIMTSETIDRILAWVDRHRDDMDLQTIDLTGGAPEMNPHFRTLVEQLTARGLHVLDRCNLTILLEEGHDDLPEFLAQHRVEIVASLPCYLQDNVDSQRGKGVYDESIQALRRLNSVGYGMADTADDANSLKLDLVYNPVGYGLPPDQDVLEVDYKRELHERFGISFNRLWTITNMPIKRFAHALKRDGQFDSYMAKLIDAHNPANVPQLMCRSLVSVGWQGSVYDCDFNQMLTMPITPSDFGSDDDEHLVERRAAKLWDFSPADLVGRSIRTGNHCFGCTAGAGSSCTGSLG